MIVKLEYTKHSCGGTYRTISLMDSFEGIVTCDKCGHQVNPKAKKVK